MKQFVLFVLAASMLMPLAGCGAKGKLKTPSQGAAFEAKKARAAAKSKEAEKAVPAQDVQMETSPENIPDPYGAAQ